LIAGICWAAMVGWVDGPSARSARGEEPAGNLVIRQATGGTEIVIRTSAQFAGAIHSLTWNGREFLDAADHGRELQSALNADAGSPIRAETFNPTEAGSREDGNRPRSTSRLLHSVAAGDRLQTTTQMAFWLAPGETSGGHPAKNSERLSNHLLTKRVTIGCRDIPQELQSQVLQYDVSFSVPVGEAHRQIVFEALTGYMPAEFKRFWRFDPATRKLAPLSDGPGEQRDPVALATADGSYAMGIVAEASPIPAMRGPTYGRFRFAAERVVKWNCVYRLTSEEPIPAGEYSFRMFVPIGARAEVETLLSRLTAERTAGGAN